jgi:hypothetical protein
MSSDELKPCPFCGASGLGYVLGGLPYYGTLELEGGLGMVSSGIGYYAICCRDCEWQGPKVKAKREQAVERAIEAWNGRTLWA